MQRLMFSLAVVLLLGVQSLGFGRETLYEFVDLGTLPGGVDSEARDINDRGAVVGQSLGVGSFLWTESGIGPLPVIPEQSQSDFEAEAINNAGDIGVNLHYNGSLEARVLRDEGQTILNRDSNLPFRITAMSNSGLMLGQDEETGAYISIDPQTGTQSSWSLYGTTSGGLLKNIEDARGINDWAQAVGTGWLDIWDEDTLVSMTRHGWIYDSGSLIDVGHLGTQATEAYDINNEATVVGYSELADGSEHAFQWTPTDGIQDLGTLGGSYSHAYAVNDSGIVVGKSESAEGGERAFACLPGLGMFDLNLVLPEDSPWTLTSAVDINEYGHVIGQAHHADDYDHGFVLRPTVQLRGDVSATLAYDPAGFDLATFGVAGLPSEVTALGHTVQIESLIAPGGSATLMMHYSEALLADLGVSEESIRLFWFDEMDSQWVLAGAASNLGEGGEFVLGPPTEALGDWGVDTVGNYAWANIDHASTYAAFAVPEPSSCFLLLTLLLLAIPRRRNLW